MKNNVLNQKKIAAALPISNVQLAIQYRLTIGNTATAALIAASAIVDSLVSAVKPQYLRLVTRDSAPERSV